MTATLSVDRAPAGFDYKVADLSLADSGRQQIRLAEHEMPGLMALREEYAAAQPLAGARIAGSLHMTIQTAVLIETLVALGAEVRWVSCNIFSTQDDAAAAVVVGPDGTAGRPAGRPGLRLEGRDAGGVLVVHRPGARAGPDGERPEHDRRRRRRRHPAGAQGRRVRGGRRGARPPTDGRLRGVRDHPRACCRAALAADPQRFTAIGRRHPRRHRGDHHRRAPALQAAPRPARCCSRRSTSTTRSPSRSSTTSTASGTSLVDGLNRATDVMLGGKLAVVCGYGDVGKGCAESLRGQGARVVVTEIDPICALQAAMDGLQVRPARRRGRDRRHLHHHHRQQGHHHGRAHGQDEAQRDRRQRRPLRQRDRHGRPGPAAGHR